MSRLWDFLSTVGGLHTLVYRAAIHLCGCQCLTEHCSSMNSERTSLLPLTDNKSMYMQLYDTFAHFTVHMLRWRLPQSMLVSPRLARLKSSMQNRLLVHLCWYTSSKTWGSFFLLMLKIRNLSQVNVLPFRDSIQCKHFVWDDAMLCSLNGNLGCLTSSCYQNVLCLHSHSTKWRHSVGVANTV